MRLLFLDFESYYDTKGKYDIKSCSMTGYIRDARFKVHGLSYAWDRDGEVKWVTGNRVAAFLDSVNWSQTILVAQNVKFDGAITDWHYGHRPAQYRDTLGLARAIIGRRISNHSLGQLATYFELPAKGEMHTDGLVNLTETQEAELAAYGCHDTWLCREIYYKLVDRFPEDQWPVLDWTIRAFTEPKLVLDKDLLAQIAKEERERRANIFELIGIEKGVFSSNDKFAALLTKEGYKVPLKPSPAFEKNRAKVEEMKKAGDPKAAKAEAKLKPLIPALALGDPEFLDMVESEDERLAALCEARIAAKSTLLETRSEKFLKLAGTGPFPFDVNFSGALNTHRLSGADGAGGNPQNLQKCQDPVAHKKGHYCKGRLRNAVCAPAGHLLAVADSAAIEARLVAWLANEPTLIKLFSENGDPYAAFASVQYGRTITKADKAERQYGKESILGLGYGMGATKFKNRIKVKLGKIITEGEARETIELYRETYAAIPQLWYKLESYIEVMAAGQETRLPFAPFLLIKDGGIQLPSGLMLQYPNLREEDNEESGYTEWVYDSYKACRQHPEKVKLYGGRLLENICQALAGELCKKALIEAGLDMVLQLHDELGAVMLESEAATAVIRLEKVMTEAPKWWPSLRLGAEVKIGKSWGEAK